jgi:hypothetical protein
MKITKLSTVSLIALLTFGFFTSSCDSVKDILKFNLPEQTIEVEFDIPPTNTGDKSLADFNVLLNMDSLIKANASNFSADNIQTLKITGVRVEASNTEENGDHFGALQSAKAELSSNNNSTLVTIAEITNNPETYAASLVLPVKDVELKDYFKATSFTYKLSAYVRTSLKTTLHCKAYIKFDGKLSL